MIIIKRTISLLIFSFIILSNFAFAQSPAFSDPSLFEGRPIDESREGTDFQKGGNFIVYPAKTNVEEGDMMGRFARGEISKDEALRMEKARLGRGFSEEEFNQGMIVPMERLNRKEAFSYENRGYAQMYNMGPSYEGYSKEDMIFARVFGYIGDDIDPREIKQNCNDPDKIAEITIQKFKEKAGDVQKICGDIEEEEAKCSEYAKKACYQMGTAAVREDASEMEKLNSIAYSCPPNKNAIVEACKNRNSRYMEQRIRNSGEECEKRFNFDGERLVEQCENFKQSNICDRDEFMERCMSGVKKKEEPIACTDEECGPAPGMPNYPCPDGGVIAGPGKCLRNSDGKCAWEIIRCPAQACPPMPPQPECLPGSTLTKKTDGQGCVTSYECTQNSKCTETAMPICGPGTNVQKRLDTNGCVNYYCEPSTINVCAEAKIPECAAGNILQKKVDERGCVNYYCETAVAPITCPDVQNPECGADGRVEAYYDSSGCATSYQCIMQQPCPEVSKPDCSPGQSLMTKYDDKRCIVAYECASIATESPADGGASALPITGNVIGANYAKTAGRMAPNTYDDFLRQCENSWAHQQRICFDNSNTCDKKVFVEKCKEQEKRNYDDSILRMEQNCELQTSSEVMAAEQRCARMEGERQRCLEQSQKRCEQMRGNSGQCKSILTEESLRKFIIDETRKKCKFTGIMQDENEVRKSGKAEIILAVLNTATESDMDKLRLFVDGLKEDLKLQETTVYSGTIIPSSFGDIKLFPFVVNAKLSAVPSSERAKEAKAEIIAGQKAEEAAGRLVSLRDSDIPKEYLYIIEDKASDVLDVSDSLESIDKKEGQKGFGYKIRLFLGMARQAEKEEISQLEGSKSKLIISIETLAKLADEVPGDVAKSILKEQIKNLKSQQEDIEAMIETKEKKSKGLFGIFG